MNTSIQEHYGVPDMMERVQGALRAAGIDSETFDWSLLAPLDQFHARGLAATKEMAALLSPRADETVMDIGSGLGGPARFLAATYGCSVTGLDLSGPFVEVAQRLTARTELSERVSFIQGDAIALPFEDGSFDIVWTQHTAMNIADRATLYAGMHRVLKPGGRLAIYDFIAGEGEPIFPLPWARSAQNSFLLTGDAMRDALQNAGFGVLSWDDKTAETLAWFASLGALAAPSPLNLAPVMGDEFPAMAANIVPNIQGGRVRLVQAILRRH